MPVPVESAAPQPIAAFQTQNETSMPGGDMNGHFDEGNDDQGANGNDNAGGFDDHEDNYGPIGIKEDG